MIIEVNQQKESSLFRIRTRRAIGERLEELKENIKARFIGERLFFLPFQWLRDKLEKHSTHNQEGASILYDTCQKDSVFCPTCQPTTDCQTSSYPTCRRCNR